MPLISTSPFPPKVPTDPFFDDVVLLLHLNGTNGSTTFTDEKGHPMVQNGDAQLSTSQQKFGTASLSLDGGNDRITTVDSEDWNYGSGDFTIEMHCRWNTVTGVDTLINQENPATYSPVRIDMFNGQLQYLLSSTGSSWDFSGVLVGTLVADTWYHIALTRSGNDFRLFIDGTQVHTTSSSITLFNSTSFMVVGGSTNDTIRSMDGYIDEVRITKGVARYTSNFTPPTTPYPNQ